MTKMVVLSDSHGNDLAIEKILRQQPDADYYIHCGDFQSEPDRFPMLTLVRGNTDYFSQEPSERVFHCEKCVFWIVHSHQVYGYPRSRALAAQAKQRGCNAVLYGHTHVYDDEIVDGVHLLNPGSCSRPRDGRPPSYAVICVDGDQFVAKRLEIG